MLNRIRQSYARVNRWANAKRGRAESIIQATFVVNTCLLLIIMRNSIGNKAINRRDITGDIDLRSETPETREKLTQSMADFLAVTKLRKEELRQSKHENHQSTDHATDQADDDRFHRIDQSSEDSVYRTYVVNGREKHIKFVKNQPQFYPSNSAARSQARNGFIDEQMFEHSVEKTE